MDKEVQTRLEKYLTEGIHAKDLAQRLRRFKLETVKMVLEMENTDTVRMDWISEGFYYLTELSEILDPQLEKDL